MQLLLRILLLLLLAFALQVPADLPAAQRVLSWRGVPLTETKSFLITEFGYNLRLLRNTAPRPGGDKNYHFVWELGGMRNTSARWAVGGSAYFSIDDDGSRLAAKARLRHWLGRNWSLDLGAGPILKSFSSYFDKSPGLVAGFALTRSDLAAITLSYELIPYTEHIFGGDNADPLRRDGAESTLYLGLRAGSYPGAVAMVAAPIAVLIHFLAVYES